MPGKQVAELTWDIKCGSCELGFHDRKHVFSKQLVSWLDDPTWKRSHSSLCLPPTSPSSEQVNLVWHSFSTIWKCGPLFLINSSLYSMFLWVLAPLITFWTDSSFVVTHPNDGIQKGIAPFMVNLYEYHREQRVKFQHVPRILVKLKIGLTF